MSPPCLRPGEEPLGKQEEATQGLRVLQRAQAVAVLRRHALGLVEGKAAAQLSQDLLLRLGRRHVAGPDQLQQGRHLRDVDRGGTAILLEHPAQPELGALGLTTAARPSISSIATPAWTWIDAKRTRQRE